METVDSTRCLTAADNLTLLPRSQTGLIVVLLIVLPLAVFWPVVNAGFVRWDDESFIARNPRMIDADGHAAGICPGPASVGKNQSGA